MKPLVAAAALLLAAASARAQVTLPLTVNGNLTIQGGGSGPQVTYTNGLVAAGSTPLTISLPAAYPTLVIRGGQPKGGTCTSGGDCWTTDFCEDGVCCCNCSPGQTNVNGSLLTTCYANQYPSSACPLYGDANSAGTSYQCGNCAACNKTGNGTCSASSLSRSSGRGSQMCRPSVDVCDSTEYCDGTAMLCPADKYVAANTQCRPASGLGCDTAAACTGTSTACPANPLLPSSTVCRAEGNCNYASSCTGSSASCPAINYKPVGTACGPPTAICQASAACKMIYYIPAGAVVTCTGYLPQPATKICDVLAGTHCDGSSGTCATHDAPSNAQIFSSSAGSNLLSTNGALCK